MLNDTFHHQIGCKRFHQRLNWYVRILIFIKFDTVLLRLYRIFQKVEEGLNF